ncbi:hypothetical protein H0H81_005602 [Sphagnurus paluster]|uniref:Uncharacterized protein n=1 Tax=Sphagnurus paluster TaxID=117069 RepID=A0A9P7FVQ4_9AGAR|nr:hypothetical protein H0H81_005602 [Sphagnurus paluster]
MHLLQYVDLTVTFQRVMHSILGTRIILHARASARTRDYDHRDTADTGQRMTSLANFTTLIELTNGENAISEGEVNSDS